MNNFYCWILLLCFMFPAAAIAQTSSEITTDAKSATDQSPQKPSTHVLGLPNNSVSFESGYGFGDLGPSNSENFHLSFSKPREYRFSFDLGRQFRFNDSSVGTGVSYTRFFSKDLGLDIGAGTGTGLLASKYRFSLGLSKPIFKIGMSINYTRVQSKAENSSDGIGIGCVRWLGHFIISGSAHLDVGHPGNTNSPGGAFGLTYYIYRKTYIGLGTDYGRASYLITGLTPTHVDYLGRGYSLGISHWVTPRRGFNLNVNYGVTSFYKAWGIRLSLFQEW